MTRENRKGMRGRQRHQKRDMNKEERPDKRQENKNKFTDGSGNLGYEMWAVELETCAERFVMHDM